MKKGNKCNNNGQCHNCNHAEYLGNEIQIQGKTIYVGIKYRCNYLELEEVKMHFETRGF